MSRKTILIVEDEEDIQQLVSYNLIRAGYQVICTDSGEQALEEARKERPDLVLLDIMLPGMDGLKVCREIRSDSLIGDTPVIMMTAKGEESDIISGFDLGADDYIVKPFSSKVMLSRIKAVLRRRSQPAVEAADGREIVTIGDLSVDSGKHLVHVKGEMVELTQTEFSILHLLARRPGWVFARQQIIDAVRGHDYTVTLRSVDVQIFSLRKKLGEWGERIETVRGIGYRIRE